MSNMKSFAAAQPNCVLTAEGGLAQGGGGGTGRLSVWYGKF